MTPFLEKIRSRGFWLPLLIVLVAVLGFFALVNNRAQPRGTAVQEKAWLAHTVQAKLQAHAPSVTLFGKIETPRSTVMRSAISAHVKAAPIKEGEMVKKGDLLVQLNDREAALALEQQQGQVKVLEAQVNSEKEQHRRDKVSLVHEQKLVDLLEQEVQRRERLVKSAFASKANVDEAQQNLRRNALLLATRQSAIRNHEHKLAELQGRLQQAKAQSKRAALDLSYTSVRAPFSGKVSQLNVSVGQRVRPGDSLVSLYDTGALELRAQIPSAYMAVVQQAVAEGASLKALAKAHGENINLKLDRLGGQVLSGRGGVDGLFRVTKGAKDLILGQTMQLEFSLPMQKHVLAVPATALYDNTRVYIMKQGKLSEVNVKVLGYRYDDQGKTQVLIKSPDLKNGMLIVTTHLPNARNGLAVQQAAK